MRSRAPEQTGVLSKVEEFKSKSQLEIEPTLIPLVVNNRDLFHVLVDEGCQCYAAISEKVVEDLRIPIVPIKSRRVKGPSAAMETATIQGLAYFLAEVDGYVHPICAYVVPLLEFPIILGKPWLKAMRAYSVPHEKRMWMGITNHWVPHIGGEQAPDTQLIKDIKSAIHVMVTTFVGHVRRLRKKFGGRAAEEAIFAVSLSDVEKALKPKKIYTEEQLREKIPEKYHDLLPLWMREEADKVNPHRPGVDHKIELKKGPDGKELPVPFGPLYNMTREELLVLKKTLKDLLDKGFIRASSSEAGAPVLFVRKPGGGLRFCCDYRALNAITRADRYPLPLISETFRVLKGAKWYTKVDVVQAFHKIRMAMGEEWKTAFRTRYGLFEWLVVPFGLTGAPATFQRYINYILREYLDDFCTAYMDDVLIYTSGTREEHENKVRLVLEKLLDAGLHLDPDKCEFAVKKVKYLGFIVHAGVGVQADPEKVKAILEWLPPNS